MNMDLLAIGLQAIGRIASHLAKAMDGSDASMSLVDIQKEIDRIRMSQLSDEQTEWEIVRRRQRDEDT